MGVSVIKHAEASEAEEAARYWREVNQDLAKTTNGLTDSLNRLSTSLGISLPKTSSPSRMKRIVRRLPDSL
jgi:hypothetical protein